MRIDAARRSDAGALMDGALAACCRAAMPLALLVTVLLFAQWPLRDAIGAGSTQANDAAQWLFAIYVAAAMCHAQRRGAHLVARPDLAPSASGLTPRWRRVGAALCVLPWAVFVVVVAAPSVLQSLMQLERFPETDHAGYFLIKLALFWMAVLLAAQSAQGLWRALRQPNT